MSKRPGKKPTPSFPLLIAGGSLAALAAGSLLYSCSSKPSETTIAAQQPGAPPTPGIFTQQPKSPGKSVDSGAHQFIVYRVISDDGGSHLKPESVPVSGPVDADLPAAAINAMTEFGKENPLPDGARALSVTIDGDTATADFNAEFQKNFTGGDEKEAIVLNAVLATLGQFPGVKQVQFTVAGKKIDSLGGTQSLTSPLLVPQTVEAGASPEPSPASQTAETGTSLSGDHSR